jgi:hypothetical protein
MNLINYKEYKQKITNEGIVILKKINDLKKIKKLEKKVISKLNNSRLIKTPKKINKKIYNPQDFRGPVGNLKFNLSKEHLRRGINHYKNLTNSITFKQPLVNFRECIDLVFNEKTIDLASKILNGKAKLGFVALSCLMKNNLPENCINFLHTDDHLNKKIIKKNKLLKLAIPISTYDQFHSEYTHLKINKFKIKDKINQYSKINELPKSLRKKIVSPKIKNIDGIFFDPDNFFHLAKKPKKKIRIILYVVFIKKGNYLENKVKDLKMLKKDYLKLSLKSQEFCELIKKI